MSVSNWTRPTSKDIGASLVVFLVALPLSLGIALASGAPLISGLKAAAIGGIIVGLLGGAPLQVSGPAAGLTVMVFSFIQQLGFGVTCAATVAAGLLQIGFGSLRFARIALAISPAVIHGMLAGIGVLIVLSQLHIVLGGLPQSSAWINLRDLPAQILDLHGPATLLGLLTIALLIVWQLEFLGKLRLVPGALVAVGIASFIAEFGSIDVQRIALADQPLTQIQWPQMPSGDYGGFMFAVFAITVVASAESLLCAIATDKLHNGPRANLDRELFGQGAANTLSGLVGGLPITGVIVRSSANINAGATTRASAVLHGVWILLAVYYLEPMLSRIPSTVLAALLVFVGAKLVQVAQIRVLKEAGELWVYLATVTGVVAFDLLTGIGIGMALAIVRLVIRLAQIRVLIDANGPEQRVTVRGTLTFLNVPKLTAALKNVPDGTTVVLDLQVSYIDHAGEEALDNWCSNYEALGGTVIRNSEDDVRERSRQKAAAQLNPVAKPALPSSAR